MDLGIDCGSPESLVFSEDKVEHEDDSKRLFDEAGLCAKGLLWCAVLHHGEFSQGLRLLYLGEL